MNTNADCPNTSCNNTLMENGIENDKSDNKVDNTIPSIPIILTKNIFLFIDFICYNRNIVRIEYKYFINYNGNGVSDDGNTVFQRRHNHYGRRTRLCRGGFGG